MGHDAQAGNPRRIQFGQRCHYDSRRKVLTADVAVIATGAWLSRLAGRWLRVPVQAGHGYSFTVPVYRPIPSPIYLPVVRVACTPYKGAIRVSGTTEFRHPHDRVIPERVEAILASASPLLDGVRWDERSNEWVGAHPVTPDGRPLSVRGPEACTWPVGTAGGGWRAAR